MTSCLILKKINCFFLFFRQQTSPSNELLEIFSLPLTDPLTPNNIPPVSQPGESEPRGVQLVAQGPFVALGTIVCGPQLQVIMVQIWPSSGNFCYFLG